MVTGRRLRVGLDAHVVGRRKTGNETYIVGLGRALAARDDSAVTAFLDAGMPWPGDPSRPAPTVVGLRARHRTPRVALELPVRARNARLDVLHVQYVMPPVAGLPVAVAIHDLSFEDRPDLFTPGERWRLRATIRPSAKRADLVLALSSFTRDRIIAHYGLEPDRVVVVPAGIEPRDAARAPSEAAAQAAVARLGIDGPYVLHVGDLIPRKNIPRLVLAVARLRGAGLRDLRLVLAGQTGRDVTAIEAAVRDACPPGDRGWVHRPGYVDDATLDALYHGAVVVAQPSLYEGFGLPALEAMARGRVLVTSSTTAVPEVVGDAGLLADPEDVDALAVALTRAIEDDGERARLHAAGPVAAARFSWSSAADEAMAAYRIVTGR